MKDVVQSLYTARIAAELGTEGLAAMRLVLEAVNEVHRRSAYETWSEGLTVFAPLDPSDQLLDLDGSVELTPTQLAQRIGQGVTIQALGNNRVRVWFDQIDPLALAGRAVVYHFNAADFLVLDGALEKVPNGSGLPSSFGLPTFLELEEALRFYGIRLARRSSCYVLQECWFDENRIYLKNKPEATMRRSLAQYLRSTLRAHELVEVREEQNVDESHPVDIKVTWSLTNRLALIEIKWLGDSANAEGTAAPTVYRDARANEGATQLAEYLDENLVRAPEHLTRGYLVVFDARRRGVTPFGCEVAPEDARYYQNLEIAFDPRQEESRGDFHLPFRFFLEPAC
jgi:hypothetical protein